MSDTLKPCPFCGNDGGIEELGIHTVSVMCWKCHAEGPTAKGSTAIYAAWNRRAPSEQAGKLTKVRDTMAHYEKELADAKAKRDIGIYELTEVAYLAQLRADLAFVLPTPPASATEGEP